VGGEGTAAGPNAGVELSVVRNYQTGDYDSPGATRGSRKESKGRERAMQRIKSDGQRAVDSAAPRDRQ
jgi:hypothetical protein